MQVILTDTRSTSICVSAKFEENVKSIAGFQAGPYFPNFPYFLTAALIFLY
jgi:hypothetical protein